ncbi:hypothetical protein EMIHUDRAFT_363214 [Emiliania huxleyi CCMP1516]|uniref:RING-type domain-containing protein n=2 Tax=Emiliania huxleyi TaxID=2903 RepID=A0A0D3KGS6_EMIH1|nr:hypothetical protein EMIHUDRAFT_365315 [Emiliania huxleyi CCMP1516]XP_005787390.1 hypothetical protein EMIHUDRAFT_363214 [Emiliania huxleyi CCMP1516]EOD30748.1 hypothetical protein EMIHUDRAFT_365315 [Emiliania huxleyi CCMP1516]EOD34961.1 hypothetical protein EMIHUDRAFT_363214 [Emiliania huxleyi CCMP1516]|eukprot:XP_005783177.1 hypothetical protein EMIHUDRAFT_365315 [Emiliania huxleyi CCMP1516]
MLPTHVLTPAEVDLLGPAAACCICLEDFAAGNRVMVVPCAGLHKVHAACGRRWLEKEANTCPACRHELPSDGADAEQLKALRGLAVRDTVPSHLQDSRAATRDAPMTRRRVRSGACSN